MNPTYAERTEGTPVSWWLVLLEGIAAAIVGILLLRAPGIALFALVQVTGFFWLIGGILAIIAAFAIRRFGGSRESQAGVSRSGSRPMASGFSGSWWAFALRGSVAVLFGLLIIIWPGLALFTLPLLILLLGAYILIDGIVTVVAGTRDSGARKWLLLIEGALGVLAGVIAIALPSVAGLAVLYVVAGWAVLSGISKVASAIRGRVEHEWLMVASGVLSVIFGIVLAVLPGAGLLALVWVVGIYAIAVGLAFIAYSYRLRVREVRRSESGRVT